MKAFYIKYQDIVRMFSRHNAPRYDYGDQQTDASTWCIRYAMNGLAQEQYKGWNFTTPGSIAFGLPSKRSTAMLVSPKYFLYFCMLLHAVMKPQA